MKKIFALMIALMLVTGFTAGCKKEEPKPVAPAPATAPEPEKPAEAPAPAPAPEKPAEAPKPAEPKKK